MRKFGADDVRRFRAWLKRNEYGKRVVYVTTAGGVAEKLCDGCLRATDWSLDEKLLLTFAGDPYQVDLIDAVSHKRTTLLKDSTDNLLYARFPPDNRWVSFTERVQPIAHGS